MKKRLRAAVVWTAVLAAFGQTDGEKGRVEGTVVNSVTGQPVRKARVRLAPAAGGEPMVGLTDAQGKYVIGGLAAGAYRVVASHDGYLEQRYGAKKPGAEQKGTTLEVAAGAVKTQVDLSLTPLGSITGQVRDENGDPLRNVEVTALFYRYGPSGKAFQRRASVETDASGEYRFFDLEPREYYVRARPRGSDVPGESYPMVFYPGATQASAAAAIPLGPGQEQRAMNFELHPLATASIRGRVVKPAGATQCRAEVWDDNDAEIQMGDGETAVAFGIMKGGGDEPEAGADDQPGRDSNVSRDGRFEVRNVTVGEHRLYAECRVGKQKYVAKLQIQLERAGLDNVELRPSPPSAITGKLRIEGESKRKVTEAFLWLEEKGRVMEMFAGAEGEPGNGRSRADGSFAFRNLDPRVYHVRVDAPEGLYVKSIAVSDQDIEASGIELGGGATVAVDIVLSANGGTIEGTVENGEVMKVALVPADAQRARTQARWVTARENGLFTFAGVAPGLYKLFAWEETDIHRALYDAEFRKPFESKGQTVEVTEKQKVAAQLTPIAAAGR